MLLPIGAKLMPLHKNYHINIYTYLYILLMFISLSLSLALSIYHEFLPFHIEEVMHIFLKKEISWLLFTVSCKISTIPETPYLLETTIHISTTLSFAAPTASLSSSTFPAPATLSSESCMPTQPPPLSASTTWRDHPLPIPEALNPAATTSR